MATQKDYFSLQLVKEHFINWLHPISFHITSDNLNFKLNKYKIINPLQLNEEKTIPVELLDSYYTACHYNSTKIFFKNELDHYELRYKTLTPCMKYFVLDSAYRNKKFTIDNETYRISKGTIKDSTTTLVQMYYTIKKTEDSFLYLVSHVCIDSSIYTKTNKVNAFIIKNIIPALVENNWKIVIDKNEDIWDCPIKPETMDNDNAIYKLLKEKGNSII